MKHHALVQGLLLGVLVLLLGTALVQERGRTDQALASAPTPARLAISADASSHGSSLTVADANALAQGVPNVASDSRVDAAELTVSAAGRQQQARVEGVDATFEQIEGWPLAAGGFFGAQDDQAASRLAVLGSGVAAALFPSGSAVGQTVTVHGVPFTVVGVLASNSTQRDTTMLVPFETGAVRLWGMHGLDQVVVELRDPAGAGTASQQIEQLLRTRHGLHAGQADDFTVSATPADAASTPGTMLARAVVAFHSYECLAKDLCTS